MTMDSPYSPLEFALLNDWQHDFPMCEQPFAALAAKLGAGDTARLPGATDAATVLVTVKRLAERGAISRIGPVFAPRRIGAGALAAVAAPAERLEEIARRISEDAHVNHNYQREHEFNLWFVVTAPDVAARDAVLASIARDTGCEPIAMPLCEEFHIDLGFDLHTGHTPQRGPQHADAPPRVLDDFERRLAALIQDGLPLCERPYHAVAERLGCAAEQVIAALACWRDEGLLKRFGIVVRHHELGFQANAMVVFDIPDAAARETGAALAQVEGVTLCYRRERCAPRWRHNVYCMVHGRSREAVAPIIERLAAIAGSAPQVLFSTRRFKQRGARYFA